MRLSIQTHTPETLSAALHETIRERISPAVSVSSAERIWLAWRGGVLVGMCGVRVREAAGARVVRVVFSGAVDDAVAARIRDAAAEQIGAVEARPVLWADDVAPIVARPMSAAAHVAAGDALAVLAATFSQHGLETGGVSVVSPDSQRRVG